MSLRDLTELFEVRLRYSGISIAYQLGGMIGGAITPIVATALFGAYGSSTPIAIYVTVLCLVGGAFALYEEALEIVRQIPSDLGR
mgnify:CR=1 FL=1